MEFCFHMELLSGIFRSRNDPDNQYVYDVQSRRKARAFYRIPLRSPEQGSVLCMRRRKYSTDTIQCIYVELPAVHDL